MYLILGLILIPLGVVVLIQSFRTTETTHIRYDNQPNCNPDDTSGDCVVRIRVDRRIQAPSYLYYGLVDFYQNARNYITSRSFDQLRGEENPGDLNECEPKEFKGDGKTTLVPCGLTADSFFNDSFQLCRDQDCSNQVELDKENIAWEIDREERFQVGPSNEEEAEKITNQDFMVWMRLAAYGTFHKLYRIIREDLEVGDYYVQVDSNFPVKPFEGEKFVFIAETKWFGGKNLFIGYSYIVVGGICLLLSTVFLIRNLQVRKHNQLEEEVPLARDEGDADLPEQ